MRGERKRSYDDVPMAIIAFFYKITVESLWKPSDTSSLMDAAVVVPLGSSLVYG